MRILVVTQYYYPEQFRINDICTELVRRGHEVTVLTGQPNYPDGEIYHGYEEINQNEEHNGVKIVRCSIRPRYKGTINLVRNYYSFVKQASKKVRTLQRDYDVVYCYQLSPITSALPALKAKKKLGVPVFLYCCDLWPESVRDTNGEPIGFFNPLYIAAKGLSKYIYRRVDRVGVKCSEFSDYLHDVCGVEKNKCCVLLEHAENTYLSVPDMPEENGCYDFMFLGNIGISQNCENIVEAASKLCLKKPFKVHFIGSGSGIDALKKHVAAFNMNEKVIFHGRYPLSEINQFYRFADCCMLTLTAKTAIGLTPPAKLSSYMAASRPIVAAAVGAAKDIIKEADCGICVDPEDIQGLADAMQYAVEHQDEFREKGKNGRDYFKKHLSLDKHIEFLEEELAALINFA